MSHIGRRIFVVSTAEDIGGQRFWLYASRSGAVAGAVERTNDLLRHYHDVPRATARNWRYCFPRDQPLVWLDQVVLMP